MARIITAVSLMFIFGGGWLALDYLNRQEMARAAEMHQGIEKARLEAKRRSEKRANFEAVIHSNQANCEAAADKAQNDYMGLMLKEMPAKRKNQAVIPQPVATEAATILQNAKTECQRIAAEQFSQEI
jgi:hypothetical protein